VTELESASDTGPFLSVFAELLLDNVMRFEGTASRVTELVTANCRPNREFIVTLQSFDRLKQEFEALGGALMRYAEATMAMPLSDEARVQLERDIVGSITVADVRDYLLQRLPRITETAVIDPIDDTLIAEVNVDVVF
jgi:hypothetical protein